MKLYCQVGDVVLALDKGIMYEAKVYRVQNAGGVTKYFIHYQGWHRKYDCWVDESAIAKKDDLAKRDKILAGTEGGAVKVAKKGKKGKDEPVPAESAATTAATEAKPTAPAAAVETPTPVSEDPKSSSKRKAEVNIELESQRRNRRRLLQMDLVDEDDEAYVAKLQIPLPLKKHLTDEWKVLTTNDATAKLLQLPKSGEHTVEKIVKAFLDQKLPKLEKDKVQIAAYQGLMDGLLVHFDKALPSILLYRQEREQYDALSTEHLKKTPSQLYGAEHLVRLFMRMPRLLGNVFLPASEVNQILQKLSELLKFIAKAEYVDMKCYVPVEEAMKDFVKQE